MNEDRVKAIVSRLRKLLEECDVILVDGEGDELEALLLDLAREIAAGSGVPLA